MLRITGITMTVMLCFLVLGLAPIGALPRPVVTCATDKAAYIVGDSVLVSGQVSSPTGQPLPDATVWILSTDPSGAYVENTKKLSDSNGTFAHTFSLQLNATEGNYTLSVSASKPLYQSGSCLSMFTVAKRAPDFAISVSPTALRIGRGESANYTILISSSTGFKTPVSLAVNQNPLANVATFNPNSVDPGNVSVMTIATSDATVLGNYSMVITANGGSRSHTVEANLTVTVPFDFAVSINSTADSVKQGSVKEFSVNVTMWGLGTGTMPVTLNLLGGPPFTNHLFSRTSGSSNFTSILTIVTSGSTTPGERYPLVVSANGAGKTRSVSASLTVLAVSVPPPFNFIISVQPLAMTISQGMTANFTVTVIAAGTPQQSITLNVLNTIPGGTTKFTYQGGPSPFTSVFMVKTTTSTNPSAYELGVIGISGSLVRVREISMVVVEPDFDLAVAPGMLKVVAGGSYSASVRVQPVGDYKEPVSLAVSSNVGLIAPTIAPSNGIGGFTATLNVRVGSGISVGIYEVLVSALGADGKKHILPYELYLPLVHQTSFGALEILSNSTVTGLTVTQNAISYKAAGDHGMSGFSNASVPVALLDGQPTVIVNGHAVLPVLVFKNQTHYIIYLKYTYASPTSIVITGSTTPVPEFGSLLPLVTSVALFAAACMCSRRRRRR
jgi:hypothetical protein